jgi:sec-independent protein translocase protein TatB
MFGIGVLELVLILLLAVIVVGPDRLPAVAADLARWIRRTRQYANHLMKDFNEVVGDLEKEVGTSREDWKEIASVVTRHTSGVTTELSRVANQVERMDLERPGGEPANVVPFESRPLGEGPAPIELPSNGDTPAENGDVPETQAPEEPKEWFVPERTTRRRPRE